MAESNPTGKHEIYGVGPDTEAEFTWGIGNSRNLSATIAEWDIKPTPAPVTADEKMERFGDWLDDASAFDEMLMLGLEHSHALVEVCMALGYDPNADDAAMGWCAWWLFDYMGKLVAENPDGV